jgi:hypothetical protein
MDFEPEPNDFDGDDDEEDQIEHDLEDQGNAIKLPELLIEEDLKRQIDPIENADSGDDINHESSEPTFQNSSNEILKIGELLLSSSKLRIDALCEVAVLLLKEKVISDYLMPNGRKINHEPIGV